MGCNFRCRFCQNADIAQLPTDHGGVIMGDTVAAEQVVAAAAKAGCRSIAYTYTEPTVFFEFALDTAKRYARTTSIADTRYPQAVVADPGQDLHASGSAFSGDYQHTSATWALFTAFESYDPGFRSDTGFVPRVDYRSASGQAQRILRRGGGSWFNRIDLGARGWRSTDADWNLTDQTVAAFLNYAGPRQTEAMFNMPRDIVVYQGRRYEYYRPNFYFGIKPTGGTSFDLFGRFGGGVDFDNNRRASRALQFSPSLEYRPVRPDELRSKRRKGRRGVGKTVPPILCAVFQQCAAEKR